MMEVIAQMPTTMLKQLSSHCIAPVLKLAGFTRHGLVWNRRFERLVHVIHVEETRWSDENESEFGISTGVAVAEVYRIVWGKELPPVVRESDCLPRFPYGYLPGVDIGRDVGWKLCGESDIEPVGIEVTRAIEQKCLPVLDACQSVQDVLTLADGADRWRQPAEKLKLAVLNCLAGREDSCQAILGRLESDPRLKAWRPRISETRNRLQEHTTG